jgi:3-dehydroquinate dehydratase/shikimate dehydrogenase
LAVWLQSDPLQLSYRTELDKTVTTQPLLCVTVTAPTTAALREARDRVERADLVELRLDTVSDPDVGAALAGRQRPVILTCRAAWEGGSFKGSEDERRRILEQAIEQGAEFVDIEWHAHFDDLIARTSGRRIVLSSHVFEHMPQDLPERARAMRSTGAEVIKIAAKANRLTDCLELLEVGTSADQQERTVLIAMGEAGLITRVCAGRFGSAWTYAGSLQTVNQVGASVMLDEYRFHAIRSDTELYGLTGSPIAHSVSPAMHNAAFAAIGRNAVYLPFPATDVDDFVTFARAIGLKGASVTIPFKVPLLDSVQHTDQLARAIGALNTIRAGANGWEGRNTDAEGFLRPLAERGLSLSGCRAAILGAGGSARAVAVALASKKASVTVHARDGERAARVAALAGGAVGEFPPAPGAWDLLVNCTPIGMHPHIDRTPVPAERLHSGLVYDLVYNPERTRLLREAAAAGCETIGGLDMLVAQAAEQFRWWTGVAPPAAVMRAAARKRLSEFRADEDHVV